MVIIVQKNVRRKYMGDSIDEANENHCIDNQSSYSFSVSQQSTILSCRPRQDQYECM